MNEITYDVGVVIGRFQPLHNGHCQLIRTALERCETVIVVLGSPYAPRTVKNPWTAEERMAMLQQVFSIEYAQRKLLVHAVDDVFYSDPQWFATVHHIVNQLVDDEASIGLFGFEKDESSYYLQGFPQWDYQSVEVGMMLNATDIRNAYFQDSDTTRWYNAFLTPIVPASVMMFLEDFRSTSDYQELVREFEYIAHYKQQWSNSPYPPIFVTVDAVIIKSGHILLIRRKGFPGEGTLALPGGFVGHKERLLDAIIREVKEETGLSVSKNVRDTHVFDYPERSLRGRTITHAYYFDLGDGDLPTVTGGDDAASAFWMPMYEALGKRQQFFEDHYWIVSHFLFRPNPLG